jgi:hypothetical protein
MGLPGRDQNNVASAKRPRYVVIEGVFDVPTENQVDLESAVHIRVQPVWLRRVEIVSIYTPPDRAFRTSQRIADVNWHDYLLTAGL